MSVCRSRKEEKRVWDLKSVLFGNSAFRLMDSVLLVCSEWEAATSEIYRCVIAKLLGLARAAVLQKRAISFAITL